uniref:Coiled-coil domain-containing protein 167 n=2 Tax=Cynoglossus semilaevis TaxID=244447 RepID=A0A3P8WZV9_CYNSE
MTNVKDKRKEKVSVATEIDRLEERRKRCQDNLEKAEFRLRHEQITDKECKELEEEITIVKGRLQKLDKELTTLRKENQKNMLLSVALFAVTALLYYAFFHSQDS